MTAPNAVSQQTTAPSQPTGDGQRPTRIPFLPALEGLRAVACCGIIVTHVAFQTGADTGSLFNRMMARTDFFVPVFFALSGFLLWRRHRADFSFRRLLRRDRDTWMRLFGYYMKRIGRIMPAYVTTVILVLALFPVAGEPKLVPIFANLTLTQIYVDGGLIGGLTHLWSLCVEMAFYLVLPIIAVACGGARRRVRILVILSASVLSFGWAFIPAFAGAPEPGALNPHVMPPAFISWFGVGFLAAELEGSLSARGEKLVARARPLWWGVALAILVVAASDGPEGLAHAEPAEFARRTLYGLVFAAALIVPYVLAPRSRWLESAWMQALGRWSYSIFLWHVGLLSLVFPLVGVNLFSGHTAVVLMATFALTVPVAALSYALVEEPARRWVNTVWGSFTQRMTRS